MLFMPTSYRCDLLNHKHRLSHTLCASIVFYILCGSIRVKQVQYMVQNKLTTSNNKIITADYTNNFNNKKPRP